MIDAWSSEWPTDPGYYWFYGCPYGLNDGKFHLSIALVESSDDGGLIVRIGGGLPYTCAASAIGNQSCEFGVWHPVVMPELPGGSGVNDDLHARLAAKIAEWRKPDPYFETKQSRERKRCADELEVLLEELPEGEQQGEDARVR